MSARERESGSGANGGGGIDGGRSLSSTAARLSCREVLSNWGRKDVTGTTGLW